MKFRTRHLMGLGLFGILVTGALVFEGGPDAVIFPKQDIPVFFTHSYHTRKPDKARGIEGEGLACDFCHENVSDSKTSADRDIPGHDGCDSCHETWIGDGVQATETTECGQCHRDLKAGTSTQAQPLRIPPPNIKFPHELHLSRGVECSDCHRHVSQKTVATRDDYPTMDRCVDCHLKSGAKVECKTCHLTGPSGRLVTDFAEGSLMPRRFHGFAIHDADFLRDHAVPAKRDSAYCQKCHSTTECLDCHDGIGRDVRYHPDDWMSTHFIRARRDDMRCQSCHRLQTFCLDCHVRSGVATVGTLSNTSARRTIRRAGGSGPVNGPHPMASDGWLDPQSRNFHGFHAQRNIRACASCHQEQYCLGCHTSAFGTGSPASFGGNPHGPNPQRLRGSAAAKRNVRACLKCHDPQDPAWR